MQTEYPKVIKLVLGDEDFYNTKYSSITDCPIARGCKRLFPTSKVMVLCTFLSIDDKTYSIENPNKNGTFLLIDEIKERIKDIRPLPLPVLLTLID